eukprot:3882638-Prorocentrum_lima.AAC.1
MESSSKARVLLQRPFCCGRSASTFWSQRGWPIQGGKSCAISALRACRGRPRGAAAAAREYK